VLLVRTIKHIVKCAGDTQCTAELGCERMFLQYTHDEYCYMLLTLCACSSGVRTDAREYTLRHPARRRPDANVFRRLEQCRLWDSVNYGPSDSGSPAHRLYGRTSNAGTIIAAVGLEPWRSSPNVAREFGLSQQMVFGSVASTPVLAEHTYTFISRQSSVRMQFCEWLQHLDAVVELFLHKILWTDEACFTC
jgi:hypothetical protein